MAGLGITQLKTPRFLRRERILGPLGNGFAFMLSKHGKQAHRKRVGIGHVAADEVYAGITELEDEPSVSR